MSFLSTASRRSKASGWWELYRLSTGRLVEFDHLENLFAKLRLCGGLERSIALLDFCNQGGEARRLGDGGEIGVILELRGVGEPGVIGKVERLECELGLVGEGLATRRPVQRPRFNAPT